MQWCIATAKETGCAAATTRNHHHFGAAVQWSRLATNADCIAVTVSSHRYELAPETSITGVNATSPMSIAIPTGDEATLALDMGASLGLPDVNEHFEEMPQAYFKHIALGAVNRALGGVVAGIYRDEIVNSEWTASNQGSFFVVIDAARLQPLAELKAEMDRMGECSSRSRRRCSAHDQRTWLGSGRRREDDARARAR